MPDLDAVLAAHVAWLRLLRRSERTIYERERAVIRLAAWLGANVDSREGAGRTSHRRPGSVAPCGGDPPQAIPGQAREQGPGAGSRPVPGILSATPADLAAWRAPPTVGHRGLPPHCRPIPPPDPLAPPGGPLPLSQAECPPATPARP